MLRGILRPALLSRNRRDSPDPAELSTDSLAIDILIDNGHATVQFQQVFRNKTDRVLEGTYAVALPGDAAISNVALWDDVTRIPGVILERKRAGELYDQIRNETIDPGLLQSGEVTESEAPGEARHSTGFSVKIVPIPAYGLRRVETEYRQTIPVSQLTSELVLPLKPSLYTPETDAKLSLSLEIRSPQALTSFTSNSAGYPLQITQRTPHLIQASFEGTNVTLNQDISIRYAIANENSPAVQAYRTGEASDPGFFDATTILQGSTRTLGDGPRGLSQPPVWRWSTPSRLDHPG